MRHNRFGIRFVRSGFTLVELVIFIVIVSTAVIGVLRVMSATTGSSANPQLRKQALSIAEALLETVSMARFTYCDPQDANAENANGFADCTIPEGVGPEPGNTFPFDNVNDYVSAYGVPQPIAITDVNNVNPNLAGYTATIEIAREALNGIPANDSLRITIRVTYGNGAETVRLDGYRTFYAPDLIP